MASSFQAYPVSFSRAQRAIHWVTVLLIAWQFIVPSIGAFDKMKAVRAAAQKAAETAAEGGAPIDVPRLDAVTGILLQSHFLVGILILALTFSRLWLRVTRGAPAEPEGEPLVFRLLAKVTHAGLYAVLLAMPLSGIAFKYLGLGFAHDPHVGPLKGLTILLIVLHVAGALVHQFLWKTNVLRRMTVG
ncbi:cytochrome b [Pseudorhizobium endolithicum]|uniref:Cytochrome b n=1 Tax=Pseudorhizobium endolithicum TaxID=1191678 RepID=A0ABN7JQH6_9HYPH|nr:cytochrome b/b6 domain-containing protein [Pseudorhizobium endolithicum]CAD7042600.1 cytochrome b [Pseudorhizobium endolithicum]